MPTDDDFDRHHRRHRRIEEEEEEETPRPSSSKSVQRLLEFLTLSWKFDELQSGKSRFASHVLGFRVAAEAAASKRNDDDDDDDDDAENDAATVTPSLTDLGIVNETTKKQPTAAAAVTTAPASFPATPPFFASSSSYPVLKYRYKIPQQLSLSSLPLLEKHPQQHPQQQPVIGGGGGGGGSSSGRGGGSGNAVPLSCLVALLDEVTTWSIIMETLSPSSSNNKSNGHSRPGVSVSLCARWVDDGNNNNNIGNDGGHDDSTTPRRATTILRPLQAGNHIDISTTITKLGTTMGFCRADVVDCNTQRPICTFEHIKYLPTGSSWFLYLGLSPVGQFLLKLYVTYILQHPWFVRQKRQRQRRRQSRRIRPNENADTTTNEENDQSSSSLGLLDTLVFTSPQDATFTVKDIHTNGFGGLQGGVQAILMEQVASRLATQYFYNEGERGEDENDNNDANTTNAVDVDAVECTQLQISYQSTASKQVHLHAEIISLSGLKNEVTVRVVIFKNSKKSKKTKQAGSTAAVKESEDPVSADVVVVVSEGIMASEVVNVNDNDKCYREYSSL
eukprot:CAMPEP_0113462636 /NCGR_PEP_ID=MMETSP0014_2-20120614/12207_1 /TAXON_ID=2857 /ORGANISM="Nitzschia sp." /LENGTH=561 /DNA_ID=CAMNT_0000354531 /DNA_START=369 /DNA_END=2058 /DNA_ORIENTATION=- /assembly_acc=CAM_ASM_000159